MDQPVQLASSPQTPHFFRGCKWSPDGTCLLTVNADNVSRVYNIPQDLSIERETTLKSAVLEVKESNLIYDFCWFPGMDSKNPMTCYYTVTSSCNPIRLVDAYSGSCVATYRAYDHLEQMKSAHSVCFSQDGSKLYAGYQNGFRIFQTSLPGTKCMHRITHSKQIKGQRGILSCIASSPVDDSVIAIGSYSKQVGLHDDRQDYDGPYCVFEGHKGGVTHLAFSSDGQFLFTGGRKDPDILVWDVRNLKSCYFYMKRSVETNQRVYFDLNPQSNLLMSGDTSGYVNIWSIKYSHGNSDRECSLTEQVERKEGDKKIDTQIQEQEIQVGKQNVLGMEKEEKVKEREEKVKEREEKVKEKVKEEEKEKEERILPVCTFKAGNDCINGTSLHPTLPLLATVSGQRHFPNLKQNSSSTYEGSSVRLEGKDEDEEEDGYFFEKSLMGENRIKLWWYPTSLDHLML